jgi:hypothetical protein
MMADIVIEQALFRRQDGSHELLARSPGFLDDWLPEAERLCAGFGARPPGVACPACVFAQPLGSRHVAVVQAADRAEGVLGAHFLVLSRSGFRELDGNLFTIAETFPAPWGARGELSSLTWMQGLLPARTVEQVQEVLRKEVGGSLLGGTQALLDGNRLVFERSAPDTPLLRDLWTLLPTNSRCELWPASFAFGNELDFHALVVPRASGEAYAGYLTEDQAAEYPQGRYELGLQIAAEAGDERELRVLFSRRTRAQTWRLGLWLLALMFVLVFAMNWLNRSVAPARKPAPAGPRQERPPAEVPRE